ncbi:hypothetical protein [Mucilaginibacter polytrichastri]|uniref:hypothetical protein n=1 Tax=Mucilaginibacter polytrichastri TaxID=1302689 RepID=UPI0008EB6649|nr:hypothetical protein [Mucilaginibacter polytrichastri]SFS61791.1 hypothetical protein SAMN04487890_102396 [Mucilaginibacter polytrichastri]
MGTTIIIEKPRISYGEAFSLNLLIIAFGKPGLSNMPIQFKIQNNAENLIGGYPLDIYPGIHPV